ncbi:hypothetical protein LPJ73_001432 [Coemansia sp. RSA 2703]|nr:hypothetical protein LPJ73_001432 [Coemansia sp. RSA 2703]KAJ2379362.1 hypothetical protein IW150_000216 [Coemansia sp. RSA 2607]KAJ2397711.1 hypothetical protein GGI05_000500 [Coemansia sp. RSA 2603]
MLVKVGLGMLAALSVSLFSVASGYEVDVEWDVGSGTKGITTAMSLLRFTNETSPPATEWVPLGWTYGTMSLQHRGDKSTFISMQLSPPSPDHQVILGKMSDIADVKYQATKEGPSQVFLEAKVELDASQPYYFKVEAHHDLKANRTTYESLYSMGEHWLYVGSLILQHPNSANGTQSIVSPSGTSKKNTSSDGESDSGSDSETESGSESTDKPSARERVTSAIRKSGRSKSASAKTGDGEDDVEDANERDSDNDKDDNNDSEKEDDSDKDSDEDEEKDSDDEKEKENENEKDGDDAEKEAEQASADARRRSTVSPSKLAAIRNLLNMYRPKKALYEKSDTSFNAFVRSGVDAFKSRKLPAPGSSPASSSATSAAAEPKETSEAHDDAALELLKNGIEFPDFAVFPKIYSGVKRMDGGDASLTRAGIYKKFQLRDRLGETLFVSKGRAFSYDGGEDDVASVRHFFMSASYLISIDGAKLPSADSDAKALSSSPSSEETTTSEAESQSQSESSSASAPGSSNSSSDNSSSTSETESEQQSSSESETSTTE